MRAQNKVIGFICNFRNSDQKLFEYKKNIHEYLKIRKMLHKLKLDNDQEMILNSFLNNSTKLNFRKQKINVTIVVRFSNYIFIFNFPLQIRNNTELRNFK